MPAYEDRSAKYTRLGRARVAGDLTQDELAEKSGVSKPTLQRLETGQIANPGIVTLCKLAWALDVELDELIEDEWRRGEPIEPKLANRGTHSGWQAPDRRAASARRRKLDGDPLSVESQAQEQPTMFQYANYNGPRRGQAVIDGQVVPFDARASRRLAENAVLLSLGSPEIAATIDTPQQHRDREAADAHTHTA